MTDLSGEGQPDPVPVSGGGRSRDERRRLAVLVVPMVTIMVVATIGDAISPTLLVEAPLVLEALIPRNRFLVLVAPQVGFWPFFVVGMVRLLLTDPLFYVFGQRYGDAAINWTEQRMGAPGSVRAIERWFRRAAYPIVVIAPNNMICTLAGASGMSVPGFAIANFGGTAVRLVLIWWAGEAFSEPLLDVVDLVGRYRWWFTLATIVIVVWSVRRARRRHTSGIETVEEIAEDLGIDGEP
ncbi:MAG: VTT domain-containing protein [Acidimicrobiia bacterium]